MKPYKTREDRETNLYVALPAANATAYTGSIYVGNASLVDFEVELGHEALPSLVDAKTVTLKLQDSADGVTFADVAGLASLVTTGAGGVGAAANKVRIGLSSTLRAYVRGAATVLAAAGSNVAQKFYLKGKY